MECYWCLVSYLSNRLVTLSEPLFIWVFWPSPEDKPDGTLPPYCWTSKVTCPVDCKDHWTLGLCLSSMCVPFLGSVHSCSPLRGQDLDHSSMICSVITLYKCLYTRDSVTLKCGIFVNTLRCMDIHFLWDRTRMASAFIIKAVRHGKILTY